MRTGKRQRSDTVRKVVIYARESVDRGGKSPENAARELKMRAESEGDVVVAVVIERGSASRHARKERERWAEVAGLIERGEVDMLMTTEFSRATRELGFYVRLRDACVKAKVLWWYGGTVFDMSKRDDRFRTGLDALRAEDEADAISERALRGHRGGALNLRPTVGSAPYGYRRTYSAVTGKLDKQVKDRTQAKIVREMTTRYLAGESLHSLSRELNARGVPTPRNGARWGQATLRQVLARPAIAGLRVHRGKVVGKGTWSPIITPDEHYRLVEKLWDPTRKTEHDGAIKHLLTGIGRCGVCEFPLRFIPHQSGRKYQCSGRYCVMRGEDFVDEIVRRTICKRLSQKDARTLYLRDTSEESRAARERLTELKVTMDQYYQQAEADDEDERLSAAGLARMERKYLPQIEEADRRYQELRSAQSPLLTRMIEDGPEKTWEALTVAQRREVIRLIADVHLDRVATRSKPDVEAVRVEFRATPS